MKANKFTVTVVVEVLSLDAVRGQLAKVASEIDNEHIAGLLCAEDGDVAEWTTAIKPVEF